VVKDKSVGRRRGGDTSREPECFIISTGTKGQEDSTRDSPTVAAVASGRKNSWRAIDRQNP
jgi:hypothetical protein